MATSREQDCWTNHAREQLAHPSYTPATEMNPDDPGSWLQAELLSRPWSSLLDFGCGTGLWRDYFRAGRYVGLDQNEAMIDGARQRWPGDDAEWVLCPGINDGARMPFPDGSFDVAFTCAVLQHNYDGQDKDTVLREFRRVLRPGGFYMGYENTYHPEWNRPAGDQYEDEHSHSQKGWVRLFQPYGFKCVRQIRYFHVFEAV